MAFLAPQAPRQPFFRAPRVVLLLIGFLVLAHLARTMAPDSQSQDWIGRLAFVPARYALLFQSGISASGLLAAALPFVSYMALHNDYTHLAINCLWLLAFGPIVARRFGAGLFLVFFLICGVAGAATYLAWNWGSPDPMIGASGAISGLMAAAIRLLPTQRPPFDGGGAPEDSPLLPLWSRQILLFSLIWAGLNLVAGVTGPGLAGQEGVIAWQAHLGGFVAGLLLAGPFDSWRPLRVGEPL